jgi:predicted dehydrogenase
VLVEKPMANSMRECREMVAAADKAGVVLMVGQTRRYDPSYRGVANVVRGGELGAVRAVRMDAMQNGPAALRHNSWLLDGAVAGGGVVISVAVHQLDLARLCIGEVRRVSATCRMLHPAFKNNAEDYAAAILEFESGAIGELFGTYSGYRQPWSESFMIFGDEGAIHAVPPPGQGHYSGPALVASTKRCAEMTGFLDMFKGYCAVEPATTDLPTDKPFVNQLLHFTDCCTTGKQPFSSGQDNLGTMKIVFGTYESARTGAPVDLARL